jgi:ferritin-like metal-binding protein YciE
MNGPAKLKELFVEGLKDAFFAEKLVLRSLKKMATQTASPELRATFEAHLAETQKQVERLLRIFDEIEWPDQVDNPVRGETYDAIVDVIDDTRQAIDALMGPQAIDSAIAASAQAVQRYQIARYGLLHAWSQQLGLTYAAQLIHDTLQEEIKSERAFGQLADLNLERAQVSQAA